MSSNKSNLMSKRKKYFKTQAMLSLQTLLNTQKKFSIQIKVDKESFKLILFELPMEELSKSTLMSLTNKLMNLEILTIWKNKSLKLMKK